MVFHASEKFVANVLAGGTAFLRQLPIEPEHEMIWPHLAVLTSRNEDAGEKRIFDLRGGDFDLLGDERRCGFKAAGRVDPEQSPHDSAPDLEPLFGPRFWEIKDVTQPAKKGGVHVAALVRGENGETTIFLEKLEQVASVGIGVPIVRVANIGALGEE